MRAAVLHEIPGELVIEDVDIDEPGRGEVLLSTAAAGLCHSDLNFVQGVAAWPTPTVPGHEAAGVVEAVGAGVKSVQPGDHVVTCNSSGCGNCEYCYAGSFYLCPNRARLGRPPDARPRLSQGGQLVHQFYGGLSSFAERMLVHERSLVSIRKDMPLDRACLLGCGVVTGAGAVFNAAKVQAGSTVAVIGCGGVGLNAVQGAAIAGASRVIAIDLNPRKLLLASTFGATDVIDGSQVDVVDAVTDLTGGGVEYAFEVVGNPHAVTQAFRMLRKGGMAVTLGWIKDGTTIELPGEEFRLSKTLRGCSMGWNHFKVEIPRYVDLYLQGRMKLDELVSDRLALDEINRGYHELERGEVARSVIVFN